MQKDGQKAQQNCNEILQRNKQTHEATQSRRNKTGLSRRTDEEKQKHSEHVNMLIIYRNAKITRSGEERGQVGQRETDRNDQTAKWKQTKINKRKIERERL